MVDPSAILSGVQGGELWWAETMAVFLISAGILLNWCSGPRQRRKTKNTDQYGRFYAEGKGGRAREGEIDGWTNRERRKECETQGMVMLLLRQEGVDECYKGALGGGKERRWDCQFDGVGGKGARGKGRENIGREWHEDTLENVGGRKVQYMYLHTMGNRKRWERERERERERENATPYLILLWT